MAVKGRIDDIKRSLAELNAWSTAFMHVKTQELVEGKNQLLEDNRELKSKIDELQLKLKGKKADEKLRQSAKSSASRNGTKGLAEAKAR